MRGPKLSLRGSPQGRSARAHQADATPSLPAAARVSFSLCTSVSCRVRGNWDLGFAKYKSGTSCVCLSSDDLWVSHRPPFGCHTATFSGHVLYGRDQLSLPISGEEGEQGTCTCAERQRPEATLVPALDASSYRPLQGRLVLGIQGDTRPQGEAGGVQACSVCRAVSAGSWLSCPLSLAYKVAQSFQVVKTQA